MILTIVLLAAIAWASYVLVIWLRVRAEHKRAALETANADFEQRLRSPDLPSIEKHLGKKVSRMLHALYGDAALMQSENILIGVPNPIEEAPECFVAWFEPGDAQTLLSAWPGCEGLFPIASNGFGDQYLVDPCQDDPPVIYFLHETGAKGSIGVTLSQFLAFPRRQAPDE